MEKLESWGGPSTKPPNRQLIVLGPVVQCQFQLLPLDLTFSIDKLLPQMVNILQNFSLRYIAWEALCGDAEVRFLGLSFLNWPLSAGSAMR